MRGVDGESMRPAAVASVVVAVSVAAVLVGAALRTLAATTPAHDPAAPAVRVGLAVVWASAQAISLASVFIAGDRRFAQGLGIVSALGVIVMAFGRGGIGGIFSVVLLVTILEMAVLALAAGVWCAARPSTSASAKHLWRLFFWMSLIGGVYLYSASPAAAAGHLTAVASVLAVCGALSVAGPILGNVVRRLEFVPTGRLSVLAWCGGIALLGLNVYWMRRAGGAVPQVQVAGVSLAPYFLAVVPIVFVLTLDLRAAADAGWRRLILPALAAVVVSLIYVAGLRESGTLAVLGLAAMTAMLLMGTGAQVAGALGLVLFLSITLRSHVVLAFIAEHLPRAGQRLLVWAGHLTPPDQLSRVFEVMAIAGVIGHAGAARLQFLVGPQVGKDYIPALVLANGGWAGFTLVIAACLLFVIELHCASRFTPGLVARSIQVSILSLIVGNLLVTTLWMGGVTPFVGVPLPVLARAGSHLVVLAGLLWIFEIAGTPARPREEVRHAA